MRLANSHLAVEISPLGAELQSITSPDGANWLWHGDAQWWTGRAPLLFPVVGKSPENAVTIDGKRYPTQPHGFARRSTFDVAVEKPDRATLILKASAATRESFPFNFMLSVSYVLDGTSLLTAVEVANRDTSIMPFGFGFHPAFVWPLPGAAGKRHFLRLANADEPRFLQLNADGLILADVHRSPFHQGEMTLDPSLFGNDALIFPFGVGSGIVFGAEEGASIALNWSNLPNFAVWTKPGAPYLCLEPWHGTAPRLGDGDAMTARPSAVSLPPGETVRFELRTTFNKAG